MTQRQRYIAFAAITIFLLVSWWFICKAIMVLFVWDPALRQ